jgi:hypothetical protein
LPSRSLASPNHELVDLNGDGFPDILELNGVARYWRNLAGHYDLPRQMMTAPVGVGLADRGVQLLDADGDGRADLLVQAHGGYYPTRFDGDWDARSLQRYAVMPTVDLKDPEVRLVDLDGDGLTDIVRSGARLECYFNDPSPRQAWQRTRRVERGALDGLAGVGFSDQRVRFADMTGDGLQDVVLANNGDVAYWPSLGHGDFGSRVRMEHSPRMPSGHDPRRVLLGDVDGDGLADLIYVEDRRVTLWINRCGNGYGAPIVIEGTPAVSDLDAVRLVDLKGTGVAGILWSRDVTVARPRETMFFLDFTGGVKPYLLNELDNNIGAATAVEYRPSTQFYRDDAEHPATRWRTPLPFPVQVVARVEAIDRLSGGKLVSEYRYHHGYWDGREREFRGFSRVDQRHTQLFEADFQAPGLHDGFEPAPARTFSPPLETRTWFHQGAVEAEIGDWSESDFSEEFWAGDRDFSGDFWAGRPARLQRPADTTALLASLPPQGRRDALRSLHGSVLRAELYALDGSKRELHPYTVTESVYGVCEVVEDGAQAKLVLVCAGHADRATHDAASLVFFPHLRATRTTQWERGEDPLTTVAYCDGYDAYGRPREQTAIALRRRAAKRRPVEAALIGTVAADETRILATMTRTTYAAPDTSAYPDLYVHDRGAHVAIFELAQPPQVEESNEMDIASVRRDQGAAARDVRQTLQAALDGWTVGDPIPAAVRLIGHTRTLYDGVAFTGREDNKLGPHGAPTRSETLAFTDAELDAAYRQRRPAYLGGAAGLTAVPRPASAPNSDTTGAPRPRASRAPAGTSTPTANRPTHAA